MNEVEKARPVAKYSRLSVNWLKKNYLALLTIAAVIALSVALYIYRNDIKNYLSQFGEAGKFFPYLGAFLISMVSSLTIVLPVPGFLLLLSMTAAFSPVLIALAASTGGIIGELSGYAAGRSGRHILAENKQYQRAENWMRKWGIWAIMFFAFVPLVPFDVAGLACGALRFPIWKFMLAGWIGKSVKFIILLLFSSWILQFLPGIFGG